MKIRGLSELNTALSNALAWRKKEITSIFLNIKSQNREHIKQILIRATVPILYAHLEGFTKEAATYYIEFVARQRLLYKDLSTNFLAISCRSAILEIAKTNQTYLHSQFIDFLTYNQSERARIPYSGIINTESNLSSKVIKNILYTIGVPFDSFWQTKALIIDGKLLYYRNKIAHGERQDVDETTYSELHDLVIELINYLKNMVENSAVQKKYKREIQPANPPDCHSATLHGNR